MSKILLSGVPGTGKSAIAKHIESNYDYFHVDMEQENYEPIYQLEKDQKGFLGKLAVHDNVLISWGFRPFIDTEAVNYMREQGYSVIWLDGNRIASFREFMKREGNDPIMEAKYYDQMRMVVVTGIVESLHPRIVNPFTDAGEFRPMDDIAKEIIEV
ncbi:MAG TPA: hypothetical protein VMR95_00220 [Candidatus Binatia bacterium]|nr:hypothetical protein [Candidatus Binatia bacterium]